MPKVEYRVVPAPKRGKRGRGLRSAEERFAHALETAMNAMAAEGWEYVRTDALPVEERTGLTSRVTTFQHMLVFSRPVAVEAAAEPPGPMLLPAPVSVPEARPGKASAAAPDDHAPETPPTFALGPVEDASWDAESEVFTVDLLRARAQRMRKGRVAAE